MNNLINSLKSTLLIRLIYVLSFLFLSPSTIASSCSHSSEVEVNFSCDIPGPYNCQFYYNHNNTMTTTTLYSYPNTPMTKKICVEKDTDITGWEVDSTGTRQSDKHTCTVQPKGGSVSMNEKDNTTQSARITCTWSD